LGVFLGGFFGWFFLPTLRTGAAQESGPCEVDMSSRSKGLCSVDMSRPAQTPFVQMQLRSLFLLTRPGAAQTSGLQTSRGTPQASVV
jgi:hypothetical protein